jgi:uncharacterized protein (TIGR03437 family)
MDKFSCWNLACTAILFCATAIGLTAQTFTILASFDGTNGVGPIDALIQGADRNFYGTTSGGDGTVFRITPAGEITTLYSFCSLPACADGVQPFAGLVQASDGTFYGTTQGGGTNDHGTVFKLTAGGAETVLYSFCSQTDCADGAAPQSALLQASDGNFYGTTYAGGSNDAGTIFKITPAGTLQTLYRFCSSSTSCLDGETPYAGLVQASDGNFYGTTAVGGVYGSGTVFKITIAGTLRTLYSFCSQVGCVDGSWPRAGVIQASDGNFYGTTLKGGTNASGTVFKVTPGGMLTTLYSFCSLPGCTDDGLPMAGLIQASDGNFYGTTSGGSTISAGTIFKITTGGVLTTLTGFCSQPNCPGNQGAEAGLVQASDGNLYGTTPKDGVNNDGTVYRLVLASAVEAPVINQSGGVVSGASFLPGMAPNSWITIYGTNLAPKTDTWQSSIMDGNLPTSLDGVSVNVGGAPAYVSYISPTQINAVTPNLLETEAVTVSSSGETSSTVYAAIFYATGSAAPAFFQWGSYAIATRQDFSLAVKNGTFPGTTTVPAKPGDVIILWGTGFGPTSPAAPEGVEVPSSTTYNTAGTVTVTVGGKLATVYGAALASGYAGLYQVAIQIPASLASGDYSVIATVAGAQSPSTTLITVQE